MAALEGPLAVLGERSSGDAVRSQNGNGCGAEPTAACRGGGAARLRGPLASGVGAAFVRS